LQQLGLLPAWSSFPYSINGKEGKFEVQLPVGGKETSAKLVDEASVESNLLMGRVEREV
jgi:carboxymethylenebutenolidase